MNKIFWTNQAREDLDKIYDFYAEKNVDAAVRICNGILKDAEILINFPEIAARESLLESFEYEFRSLVTHSRIHKIVYFVDRTNVVITHVWDCRRNPASFPKEILIKL